VEPRAALGRTPAEHADPLGWLDPEVRLAHSFKPDAAGMALFAATGTGAACRQRANGRLGPCPASAP
jgi:8-oxoguanine deaminase